MKMSGNGFSNISGAFAGAANGLNQWAGIRAQRELEEMKDKRAENLARMQFNWKAQHDLNLQDKSFQHDTRMEQMKDELQGKQILAQQELQQKGQEGYMDRLLAADDFRRKEAEAKETAYERKQSGQLAAQNRLEMGRRVDEVDNQIRQYDAQIRSAVSNSELSGLDPSSPQYAEALARHPEIQSILSDKAALMQKRGIIIADHTAYGASLGDNSFQGYVAPGKPGQPPPGASSGPASGSFTPDGGTPTAGNATPDNPNDRNLPVFRSNPDADNAPAVAPGAATGYGSTMPPTIGPMPPPRTSYVGPLRQPNQLIPQVGSDSGTSAPPGQFSGIANPVGAPPQLIPSGM